MPTNLRQDAPLNRAKRDFAEFLHEALISGQRPDGRHLEKPWTDSQFAAALAGEPQGSVGQGAVGTWHRKEPLPVTPNSIEPILKILYGDKLPGPRGKMLALWQRAKGIVKIENNDSNDTSFNILLEWDNRRWECHLRGIELRLHRPSRFGESDMMQIEATLWIEPAIYESQRKNRPGSDIVIGIRDAFLSIESERYQTARQSLISERGHANFVHSAGAAKIIKPVDSCGRISGDPLGNDYLAVAEPYADGPEQITVLLTASRRCFDVSKLSENGETKHVNRDAVLNALIISKLERHPANGRVVLARAQMYRTESYRD